MKTVTKTYFTIMRILDLIFGILFCITIVGLIIGIPFIISSKKFEQASEMQSQWLVDNRTAILGWGIFNAIILAPSFIGLILILVFAIMANSYINDLEDGNMEKANQSFGESVKETFNIKPQLDKETEQLAKLKKMYEDGLITEEEYNAKRKKILGI